MDCIGSPTTKQVRPSRSGHAAIEMREQLMLPAAGVLELVDQQVANAIGNSERGLIGESVFAFEHILRNLRHFNVVGCAGFGEHDLQLAGGMAQQREAGPHDLPSLHRYSGPEATCTTRRARLRDLGLPRVWRSG